ncbi:hypothetical protein AN478_02260 [Thiohalorhabdus denitrificans]|uniref:ABC-type transport system involved in multi-copper enzyme maturation, permease component n=1 Tax=Thiohalorhabdus denitrificans TaxID=381306 RepID=A0A0N8PNG0_9GAMM|nr:ABC transporter permease subunit [Thiohalorhabdus denitrificans]KPV41421.1 hypothetical protein AN478_02260 [Thiohalorhabdus denitrificans]SCY26782.1 ABC-type transport system involved in multi-copper enzyme maturation, permease component [Thiohalorhabdus denitrificans]
MYFHFLTGLRLGVRSRSFFALVLVGLLAMVAAYFASFFSGRHPATIAMDVGVSAIRILGVLLVLFWTQELFSRDIDRKVLFSTLTYPLPRRSYVLGRFLGLGLLVLAALVVFGLLLAGLGSAAGFGYQQSTPVNNGIAVAGVVGGLWVDLMTVAAFTWLLSSVSTSPLLPFLLGLAFAWAARTLGPVLAYLSSEQARGLEKGFEGPLNFIRWLLPDLSRLDFRDGLLYGQWPETDFILAALANGAGYILLLLGLSVLVFNRREFG